MVRRARSVAAFAVAIALFVSSAAATVVAIALPWGFQLLGQDPAFGSGPLATVIQDLLTIVIYFAVAIPIVSSRTLTGGPVTFPARIR